MAAVAEIAVEQTSANTTTTTTTTNTKNTTNKSDTNEKSNNKLESPKSDSEFNVQKLVDMFTKLNPLAKEFFPSYYHQNGDDQNNNFANNNKHSANDNFPRRRRNNYTQGRKRLNGRAFRAQREDSIRRTVYVSDIDQNITEERLAGLFSSCGQVSFTAYGSTVNDSLSLLETLIREYASDVIAHKCMDKSHYKMSDAGQSFEQSSGALYNLYLQRNRFAGFLGSEYKRLGLGPDDRVVDCRVCGDPHSVLRFAFVEFADEHGARTALNLGGTMLGYYPVRVLPSKTAILPVNPTFLPRSDDEREMCSRTVYCTNIDKKVSQAEVKNFFETACGEVTRLRLLGDNVHSTRIAFVEFAMIQLSGNTIKRGRGMAVLFHSQSMIFTFIFLSTIRGKFESSAPSSSGTIATQLLHAIRQPVFPVISLGGKCHHRSELQWDGPWKPARQGKSIKDTCEASSYSPGIALADN
ncbi:hypothetical protein Pint_04938 [Pistacia integerrima]|uniref:Uncharacterized protein n=1 Tax=Pistacia integerrima TaxID=434235 RepID=A0ACC0Z9H0_9ROSI|nr:hypothetical protein Pint_04938 [Pistacia integerrima]